MFSKNQNNNPVFLPCLSFATISFILGILCAFSLKPGFILCYTIAAFVVIVAFVSQNKKALNDVALLVLFFCVGMVHTANFSCICANDISRLAPLHLPKFSLRGELISQVRESAYDRSFLLKARVVKIEGKWYPAQGKVLVRYFKKLTFQYGDSMIVDGTLRPMSMKSVFNRNLARQGIRSVFFVDRESWMSNKAPKTTGFQRCAYQTKDALKKRFDGIASPAKEFLVAFVLGDRSGLTKDMYAAFRYTGTIHILAVSGLHIVIILFMLLVVLKFLRVPQKPQFIISVVLLIFYAFITGLVSSVVRSVIMGIVFSMSFFIKREYHGYNSLAFSALIILFLWPWQIFDVGFQLSFLSVLSIIGLCPRLGFLVPIRENRLYTFFRLSFLVSLSTWIGVSILIAYYFGNVSVISVIANLVVVPLSPLILGGGMLYLFATYWLPHIVGWLGLSLEVLMDILLGLAIMFSKVPWAYFFVERFPLWVVFCYYITLAVFVFAVERKKRPPALLDDLK